MAKTKNEVVTTSKKSPKTTTKKVVTPLNEVGKKQLATRKELYNSNDIMQLNSSVKKAKNSELPFLNKKQLWLYTYLAKNDIEKKYNYTITSLSNDYRKEIKDTKEKNSKVSNYTFRKSFKSNEVFSIGDIKSIMQYFYIANRRLWEFYRNEKNNYLLHEVEFVENLTHLK